MRRIRPLAAAAAAALPLTFGLVGPAPIPAAAQVTCTEPGAIEAAIGVPGEAVQTTARAGVVEIRYRCPAGQAAQALRLPRVHAGDGFGTAVARGYFNDDAYEDVAVGVPGLDVNGDRDAGGVAIFYGSRTTMSFGRLITQASSGIPGAVQTGARFGAALGSDGYAPDRTYVLRVGVPGKTVSGHDNAGGFVDLPYVRGRLINPRQVTLASPGIPGLPGTGDQLGASVAGNYAVGAPGRTVNGEAGAGAVLVSLLPYGSSPTPRPATLLTQSSPGIEGVPEAGDHFGAALIRNWVGVPGEAIGSVAGAGVVQRYYFGPYASTFDPITIVPGSNGVPGRPQVGAHFGASVNALGFYVDDTDFHANVLLLGAPGATVAGQAGAGSLTAVGVHDTDPDGDPFSFTGQYQVLTGTTPVAGAGFGSSAARLSEDAGAVGAPGAAGGRVSRYATTGSSVAPLPLTLTATWAQQAGKPETGDRFGASVAGAAN